jgi:hypothetical protein
MIVDFIRLKKTVFEKISALRANLTEMQVVDIVISCFQDQLRDQREQLEKRAGALARVQTILEHPKLWSQRGNWHVFTSEQLDELRREIEAATGVPVRKP